MLLGWQRKLQLLNDAWISHLIRESTLRTLLLRRSSCRWAACVSHRFIFRFIRYACQRGRTVAFDAQELAFPFTLRICYLEKFFRMVLCLMNKGFTISASSSHWLHTQHVMTYSAKPQFFLVYVCACSNLSLVWNERLICNNEVVAKIEQLRAGERTVFKISIAKWLKARREGLKQAFEIASIKYLSVSLWVGFRGC